MPSPTQKTVSVAAHVAAINSGSQPVHGTYTTAAEGTDALVHRPPGPPSTPPPLELSEPGLNDALLAQIELAANAHFTAVESGREAASTLSAVDTAAPSARRAALPQTFGEKLAIRSCSCDILLRPPRSALNPSTKWRLRALSINVK